MGSASDFLKPVSGFRALTHLSLICLHVAMLVSGHLPSTGAEWDKFKGSYLFTCFQAGAIQVDLMFALSGFLLVFKILQAKTAQSLIDFIKGRVLRLLPPIIAISVIGVVIGDSWEIDDVTAADYKPVWLRLATMWTFVLNYVPQAQYGSFTLSLCWSCCVDLHSGAIITVVANFVRSLVTEKGSVVMNKEEKHRFVYALRNVFIAWLLISLATRAILFDKDGLNMYKLGKLNHFGNVMTDNSYSWIAGRYDHDWKTSNTAGDFTQHYLDHMYTPTHTRYGPFAVGGIMACNLYQARAADKSPKGSWLGTIVCWFFTIQAIIMLVIPCIPQGDEEAPVEAQLFVTAAIRTVASASGAFLLFRALVPSDHPWHWGSVSSLLSSSALQPIAEISYCSYLVHFRVLLELCYNKTPREIISFGLSLDTAEGWIAFMPRLFLAGTAMSLLIATALHGVVERPFLRLATNNTTQKTVTSFGDMERMLASNNDNKKMK